MLADGEEQRFGALGCQCLEYGWRIAGPRTVVEGQHHFSLAQEIVGSEVLESEARPPGRVDFHDARDAERVRIARTCCLGRDRRGCRCRHCQRFHRIILRRRGARRESHRDRQCANGRYTHPMLPSHLKAAVRSQPLLAQIGYRRHSVSILAHDN